MKLSTETWPDWAPPIRASSTPVTSGSAATACSTLAAGPKSCPEKPRNVPSCQVWPNRAGLAAASDTPAEKVKAASTPSTPGYRAEQGRPDRHGRPAAPGLEREPGAHHHRDAEPGGRRGRGHAGAARHGVPPAGAERQGRGGGRSGRHQERRQDPAGAEDQPVGVDARVRLGV